MNNMERRQVPRFELNQEIRLRLGDALGFIVAKLKNINLKGIQVYLNQQIEVDKYLKISMQLAQDLIINLEAWVVWQKVVDGIHSYGLYFTTVKDSDKERLSKFINRSCLKELNQVWWDGVKIEKDNLMSVERLEDKRVFARSAVSLSLSFFDLNSNNEGEGQTQDISAKGIGLTTDRLLLPRTPLEMWLKIPNKPESVYTRGEVVWSKPIGEDKYKVGVNLERADLKEIARLQA